MDGKIPWTLRQFWPEVKQVAQEPKKPKEITDIVERTILYSLKTSHK